MSLKSDLSPLAWNLFKAWKRYLAEGYPEIDLPPDEDLWEAMTPQILALIDSLVMAEEVSGG